MKNRLLQNENLSIEKQTKLRMLNIIIALVLLFVFVVVRIYRIQHHHLEPMNKLVIDANANQNASTTNVVGQYARVSFNEQQFWLEKTDVLPIYINDAEIFSKAALRDRDIVRIGSTLMWFQTVPSMIKRRIIYRQPRRNTLQVTFGNDTKKCDIIISVPLDSAKMGNNSNSRFMTLTFQPDSYIVTAHAEIPVKLPFREATVAKGSQEFEAAISDISAQELLILGSTKIVFSYQKGQSIVEIAILEQKESEPRSIWQARFIMPKDSQQISLSNEQPLAIMGNIHRQPSGFLSAAKEMFLENILPFYTAIILIGFISIPLTRRKKMVKYLIFWFVTFWAVLGSAIIFGDNQADEVVEEDFLANVKTAIDRGILFLDNKNHLQLKNRNSELLRAITTQGHDIRKFIKSHNDFIQSNGRVGQDWFIIANNRQILGLKKEAVTIKNFNLLQKNTRGRFLDRDGKSVAKLKVIESHSKALKPGAEIWFLPQSGKKFRKDIVSLTKSQNKNQYTLLNIGKLEIALRDGKIYLDNNRGDYNLTWYTKIKVSSKGKIYNYPVLRKIRPNMIFVVDYNEGWGIINGEEIAINQDDNQIKFSDLITVAEEKSVAINAGNNFPPAAKFQHHLSITRRGAAYYVQNLGLDEQEIFIGGSRLMPKEERELQPYDFIRIGNLLLEYLPEGDGLLANNRENGRRYYPVDLSQTVGYFCYPDLKGNLEKTFDSILSDGKDVVLTIDDDLQRIVVDELKLGLKKAGLHIGTVVLLEVETGDILAMASEPSYDQNDRNAIFAAFGTDKIDPRRSPILNRALHKLYPPGSFFKVVIASAALQNTDKMPEVRDFIRKSFSHNYITRGVVLSSLTPSKRHAYAIHPLKDHDHKTHKNIDIYEAFAESCNVYFASLAIQLGYASLNRAYYPPQNPLYTFAEEAYLFNDDINLLPLQTASDAKTKSRVGFDTQATQPKASRITQKHLSDLLDRQASDVLNPSASEMPSNKLHPSDLSRVGIGQFDVRITPLEAALILSTIANDGIRHTPRLVKQIGKVKFSTPKGKRVLSARTAHELKTMMQKVATDGTARYEFKYSKLNDDVAGKTGTPKALDMADKYHAIFGCFAPISKHQNKPQVALVVFVEYGESASIEAVPIARRILEKVAAYYGWR